MSLFDEYRENGWALCDIPLGSKGPRTAGWNKPGAVARGNAGIGLCHAWSGTGTADVDYYPEAREFLAAKAGIDLDGLLLDRRSTQIVSGRVDRAKLLYKLPRPMPSVKLAPYQKLNPKTGEMQTYHALELRCATADGLTVQDVLPPTIHPDTGKPYQWVYGDEVLGHWSNPPMIPDALLALWEANLPKAEPAPGPAPDARGASFPEIEKLLARLDPDCSYDEWLRYGMAIHHETKGEGFGVWDAWSSKGSKYPGTAELRKHWTSFGKDHVKNPATIGALLRAQVATPAQFEVVPAADVGEDTRPDAVVKAILEKRLVFVKAQESYYDLESVGAPWLSDRAIQHVFCPQMPSIVIPGKNGKPDKSFDIDPVTWLKKSDSKLMVDAVGLHPGAGRLYGEDGVKYVNHYIRTPVEELTPSAAEKEAFAFLWGRMVDPIFKSWLLKFFAYALQNPGVKIQSAPLLVSAQQGTGKNTLMKVLPEILFGCRYVRSMSGSVLGGQFNDTVAGAWWLYLEELRAGNNKSDRSHTTNKIKSWITDNTIEVHRKGQAPYELRNRLQVTATSNFDDALQLDNNDRRWAIGEMRGPLTASESLDLYDFLLSDRAPGVLHHIFKRVDVSGFKPAARAPDTMAKREMIVAGIGTWESKLIDSMINQRAPFDKDLFKLQDVADVMTGQGVSLHQLGRILRRSPFNCDLLPHFRKHRYWAWRNHKVWNKAAEGERHSYCEGGPVPRGWVDEIPKALLEMSAEHSVDSIADLL